MKEKLYIGIIVISAICGIYFIATGIGYAYHYLVSVSDTARNEYIGGAILSAVISLPFWIAVSALLLPIRKKFSKKTLWMLNAPLVILGVGFIIIGLYKLFMALVGE